MTCTTGLDNEIEFLIQRKFKNPSATLLYFEAITRFNLVPALENMDSIILGATLLVQDGSIYWAVQDGWSPNSDSKDEATWISSKRLRWRAVDWLGDGLHFGPK